MIQLTYRDATVKDLPVIVEIYNSTVASRMVTADTEPVSVESRLNWFNKFSSSHRPLWIIEDPSYDIVGWVSFQSFYGRPAYNTTVELSIYLHPLQRGKGLGKIVLQHCLAVAPAYGIKTILGYIFAHNEPSLRLFYSLGFQDWGTLPDVAILDSVERTLKILGKKIL